MLVENVEKHKIGKCGRSGKSITRHRMKIAIACGVLFCFAFASSPFLFVCCMPFFFYTVFFFFVGKILCIANDESQ